MEDFPFFSIFSLFMGLFSRLKTFFSWSSSLFFFLPVPFVPPVALLFSLDSEIFALLFSIYAPCLHIPGFEERGLKFLCI